MGTNTINDIKDKAIRMLELDFPTANFVDDVLLHISDQTLCTKVMQYHAKVAEIECIWVQQEELVHPCYLVGLEQGLSWHQLQDACAIQHIVEEMV